MDEKLLKFKLVGKYGSEIDLYELAKNKTIVEEIRGFSSKLGTTMDKYLEQLGFKLKYFKPALKRRLIPSENGEVEIIDEYRKNYLFWSYREYRRTTKRRWDKDYKSWYNERWRRQRKEVV